MNEFQNKLKLKMHEYVRFVYQITKKFPKKRDLWNYFSIPTSCYLRRFKLYRGLCATEKSC